MGKLNNIQDKVYSKMLTTLSDVSYEFTAKRETPKEPYDPRNPEAVDIVEYSGKGIFGLSFSIKDSELFQIQEKDQKAILFQRYCTNTPDIEDEITYSSLTYKVINISVIPADNGWVLQLRRV